jgi:GT2 family glycosyltransferase
VHGSDAEAGSQSAEALAALNGTLRRDVEALGGRVVLAAQNVYLGAARNRCARLSRGDYLFFLDDDDLPKPHMLERMLRVALRTRADFVACHYDVFASEVSPLEEPEAVTRRHVYAFLGPAASLALAENCIGGAAMLVRRAAFERLGGFSEYTDVGGEDYELLVRALLQGLAIELVPEPLVFVRDTPDSMAKTMLLPLVRYRALVPYLNHYPLLVDALLLARGLADRLARAHDGRRRLIADSRLDFRCDRRRLPPQDTRIASLACSPLPFAPTSPPPPLCLTRDSSQQGQFGWWYGFVEEREQEQKDTSEAETAAVAAAEMTILSRESPTQFAFFDAREGRWRYARSPYGWPYIERDNMHPYANGSLQIHPLRRLVLPCGGNFSLFLDLQKDPTRDCGDGVTWRVLLDGRELWRQEATEGTRLEEELRFEAPISSRLDLLVQAHQYDVCDLTGVHMRLFLLLPS